jgi:hypothetical protein
LQLTLNKKLTHGLTVVANYTWSKLLDKGSGDAAAPGQSLQSACGEGALIRTFLSTLSHRSYGNRPASTFGRITGAGAPRVIQLALKYLFWSKNVVGNVAP